jgi:hypothetical protein
VLSGRGLCDGPITRPDETYREVACYCVRSRNLKNDTALARGGLSRQREKNYDSSNKEPKL